MSKDNLAREASILRLFRGLPSWDGKVTRRIIDDYLEIVGHVRPDALGMAVERFRRGQVPDHDLGFPATAPELCAEAERIQADLENTEYWEKVTFVPIDSPEWKALCEARGRSMPNVERKGVVGWYVDKNDLPPLSHRIAYFREDIALLESPEHQTEMRERIANLGKSTKRLGL